MGVPVRRRCLDGPAYLVPRVEAMAFERQRPPHFPPRFDQVEIGCIGGLEDKLPGKRNKKVAVHPCPEHR